MKSRDVSITLALSASLTAHALLAWWLVEFHNPFLSLDIEAIAPASAKATAPLVIPTPPPPVELPELYPDLMGEATGQGDATAAQAGDEPMQARDADQTQPMLSQDPQDGSIAPERPSVTSGSENSPDQPSQTPAKPTFTPLPEPSEQSRPFGLAEGTPDLQSPKPKTPVVSVKQVPDSENQVDPDERTDQAIEKFEKTSIAIGPVTQRSELDQAPRDTPSAPLGAQTEQENPKPEAKQESPDLPVAETPRPDSPAQRSAEAATPSAEASQSVSSESGEKSDSESDAFLKNGAFNLRNGKVDARFGRKVKIVRPRFTVAGLWDQFTPGSALAILAIAIDSTGKVTHVEILRSSGSNEIDLPIQRAMYSWWIEPMKDKSGKAIADVTVWTIQVR